MFKFLYAFIFLVPIFGFSQTVSKFSSEGMNIKVEKIASNLGVVWGMTFISDNKMLFTVKSGEIGILNINTKKIKYLNNAPDVLYQGQGGLLDVQVSSNFQKDNLIFFTYVKELDGDGLTVLAKAEFKNDKLDNWKDILLTKSKTDTSRHFGSRITFDEKGHIFFSVGDRGVRPNGQDLTTHAGSILRLNFDGTVPSDNPFVNEKNKLPEIYSFGLRNPQGLFYDKVSKKLWSIEHGPRGGDEINLIEKGLNYGWPIISYGKEYWNPMSVGESTHKKGLNYGWPIISYGKEYWNPMSVGESTHKKGMEQPIKYYVPSIAPSSLIVYRGEKFSKWNGNLFSGALKLRHLNRIVLDKNNKVIKEERLLENLGERIRNVIQSPKENLLISTDSGNVFKLSN